MLNRPLELRSNSTIFLLVGVIISLFAACQPQCPKDKDLFLEQHLNLMKKIKQNKYRQSDEHWNHYDAVFRSMLKECFPLYATKLTQDEKRLFWRNNLGYLYARYGLKLLKKFQHTDQLIQEVRDSLQHLGHPILSELDSLQADWPIFVNLDPYSKERLVNIFEKRSRPMLLPASDSIIRQGE